MYQRGLNDLPRARLSCGRMIRLHAHPLPLSSISKLSLFLSLPVCRRSSLLTGEGEGLGVGVEPNHTTVRRLGLLYILSDGYRASLFLLIALSGRPKPELKVRTFSEVVTLPASLWSNFFRAKGQTSHGLSSEQPIPINLAYQGAACHSAPI
jgi:hypothetical protein